MTSKEDTLRRIEEFNKRAEDLRKPDPLPVPTPPDVSQEVKDILNAPEGTTTKDQELLKQAEVTSTDIDVATKKREREEERRQIEEGRAIDKVQAAGSSFVENALDRAQPGIRWFENVPTPTGLGTLIAVIVIFLLAIVPVDSAGNTRLKLIWYVLSGKAGLKPVNSGFGGGSGGNFSSTSSTSPQTVPLNLQNIQVPDLSGLNLLDL